jgi:catechol 2,3-dioxygenase-like lactoylglutathione lyase family enzyme
VKQPSLDHVVIAVSDFERSNRFYADVLGAEVIELERGRYAYRFGEQQLNVHGPDSTLAQPRAAQPAGTGASDLCFVWPGRVDEVLELLWRHGIEVELGPLEREGARGTGTSVYFRDPDGNLLELIVYAYAIEAGQLFEPVEKNPGRAGAGVRWLSSRFAAGCCGALRADRDGEVALPATVGRGRRYIEEVACAESHIQAGCGTRMAVYSDRAGRGGVGGVDAQRVRRVCRPGGAGLAIHSRDVTAHRHDLLDALAVLWIAEDIAGFKGFGICDADIVGAQVVQAGAEQDLTGEVGTGGAISASRAWIALWALGAISAISAWIALLALGTGRTGSTGSSVSTGRTDGSGSSGRAGRALRTGRTGLAWHALTGRACLAHLIPGQQLLPALAAAVRADDADAAVLGHAGADHLLFSVRCGVRCAGRKRDRHGREDCCEY